MIKRLWRVIAGGRPVLVAPDEPGGAGDKRTQRKSYSAAAPDAVAAGPRRSNATAISLQFANFGQR